MVKYTYVEQLQSETKVAKSEQEREDTRFVRDLRKQLIKLKREVAHLRKRNHYLEGLQLESIEEDLEQEEEKFKKFSKVVQIAPPELTCPACRSTNVSELALRGISYYNCGECNSKGKLAK